MAVIIKVKCNSCKYEKNFTVGATKSQMNREVSINEIPAEYRTLVRHIFDEHKIDNELDAESYGYQILQCRNCHRLYNKFMVDINYDDGNEFTIEYKCDVCDLELSVINGEKALESEMCPKCKEIALTGEITLCLD